MKREEGKKRDRKVPFFESLQVKYALSYFAVFAVILVLLNTYPLIASQDLLFTSKRDAMKGQIGTVDGARNLFPIALIALGYDPNSTVEAEIAEAKSRIDAANEENERLKAEVERLKAEMDQKKSDSQQ